MSEIHYTRIIIQSSQPARHYSEQETAEYSQLPVPVIRRLRAAGLVQGIEVVGGEYRYSEADLARLRQIRRLQKDLGVNLAGVEVILHMYARLEALQRELDEYRSL
jgi:MerR family transcriptional regulator/heat shock protein HspR